MKPFWNKKGQGTLEVIMLMALVISVWAGVSKVLRDQGFFQKLFGDSWARLSNTIEYGVPSNDKKEASKNLPGTQSRIASRIRDGS